MTDARDSVPISAVAEHLGLSAKQVRQLTDNGILPADRTPGGHRRYHLDEVTAAWKTHLREITGSRNTDQAMRMSDAPVPTPIAQWEGALEGLDESTVWQELAPALGLATGGATRGIVNYVFTEMLNNAIDHSAGSRAVVRAWTEPTELTIEITDDGVGAFRHLATAKGLPDLFAAIQELTKRKQTTDPSRHTGEGIFVSSKAVDLFRLSSNGIAWTVDNLREDQAVGVGPIVTGTQVRFTIAPDTSRSLGELFRRFSQDHEFTRTQPVIKLFEIGVTFVSRSEAKRLLEGLDQFTEVVLDFKGVESVGQGFVDEVFRVWPQSHPGTTLTPVSMNDAVEFMVKRGLPADRE